MKIGLPEDRLMTVFIGLEGENGSYWGGGVEGGSGLSRTRNPPLAYELS